MSKEQIWQMMSLMARIFILLMFSLGSVIGQIKPGHPERVIQLEAESYELLLREGIHFSIDQVLPDGRFSAYVKTEEIDHLNGVGIDFTYLPIPSLEHDARMWDGGREELASWDSYPTYSAYVNMMYQFATDYPALCRIEAFDTLNSGRVLLAAVISDNVDSSEAEPKFLYTSSMHGDELVGYVLMLRLIDFLLSNYSQNPRITAMIDGIEIWINPLANPDGTFAGGNTTVNGATRGNANYIDFNRNFPDPQDGPHPDGYPWQEETLAFMALAAREGFNMSCNIHGGAEVCNYPWDTWSTLPADNSWWVKVCNDYADSAQTYSPPGYLNDFGTGVTNGYQWYSINGGRQDYMNYFHHCREFTLEISNTKLPSASQLPAFWNYNYRSLLNYLEEALYGVRGIITDAQTGQPIEAMVSIQGHDMDSSEVFSGLTHGNYHRYLHAGIYDITFSAPGYISHTESGLSVFYDQPSYKNVSLMPMQSGDQAESKQETRLYYDYDQGVIMIHGSKDIRHYNDIELFTIDGSLVYSSKINGNRISIGQLLPGSYIVVLTGDNGVSVHKLVSAL